MLIEYIISVGRDTTEEDIDEELRSKGFREAREVYMTIAERLREKGKIEGEILGQQNMILQLLEKKFGGIAEAEKEKVMNVRDRNRLHRAIDRLLDAKSIEEVLKPLK